MSTAVAAILAAVLTFAGGMVGLYLQRLLPEQHSIEKSRDMIGSVMGLVTLLLALVLGTIVGSAYFFSSTQQSELQTLATRYVLLDRALAQYGPETKPMRDKIKDNLTRTYNLFWGGGDADPKLLNLGAAVERLQPLEDYIASLDPKTPTQKQAVASAAANFGVLSKPGI
jgi:hypothetical protein